MSRMNNKVILIGNLGKDPLVSETKDNRLVCNFSVATKGGSKEAPTTDWHNCVAFGKAAEIARDYLKKGAKVAVEGKLQYDKYPHKTYPDIAMFSVKIIVSEFMMLDSKSKDDEAVSDVGQDDNEDVPF